MLKTFKPGGVRLVDNKLSAHSPIINVELPRKVILTLAQHIGKPAQPVVAIGDKVTRGSCVAMASGRISAPVHTPVTGTVKYIGPVSGARGFQVPAIVIEASDDDHRADVEACASAVVPVRSTDSVSPAEILDLVSRAGVVGLGGATFPTAVKISVPAGKSVDCLVINGVECEPYLTCDHALMSERPDEIIEGVRLVMKAVGVERAVIGIENNKSDVISLLRKKTNRFGNIEVVALKERYPQGGEKQLIYAFTRRVVPSGGLPADVGVVVVNVATAYAVNRAVIYNEPLMSRIVTVTGPEVPHPANYCVPLGTAVSDLLMLSGCGDVADGKVIFGGPMMGAAVSSVDVPVEKGISGILLLPGRKSHRREPDPCVRCAKCVSACPMGLQPYLISTLSSLGRITEVERYGISDCIECGSCSYVCPSARPLLDFIRYGKVKVRDLKMKSKS